MKGNYLYSACVFAMVIAGKPAFAQDADESTAEQPGGIGEIVVTAERRTSTAQKTAASISVRSGDVMRDRGRYTLANILEDVPGLAGGAALNGGASDASGTDNPASGIVIRGIRSNVGTGAGTTSTASAAAIYVDDVYNGIGGNYDLDRVEVLRGPQGTLYGRSATSGVVAIHTRAPDTSAVGGDISIEAGNFDLFRASLAINVPLVEDKIALRISGNHYERGSFWFDDGSDRMQSDAARVKLLLQPSDALSVTLGYAFDKSKTRSAGYTINQPQPDVYVITGNVAPVGKQFAWSPGFNNSHQYWANVELDLGSVGLTYIPAYRTFENDYDARMQGGPFRINVRAATFKDTFHTQELRLHSQGDSSLKWQIGGVYYKNSLHDLGEVVGPDGFPPFFFPDFVSLRDEKWKDTTALGAFAEATYSLSDATRVTAGLRYDHTKVVVEQDHYNSNLFTGVLEYTQLTAADGTREFNNVTYKARIEHDLTPKNMVYASVSTGFSPGDVVVTINQAATAETVKFDAQTLTAYEIGTKNRFADGKIQLNAAAFYNDYGGYQLANINLNPDPFGASLFRPFVLPMRTYGVEGELVVRPWENGQLLVNASYTVAKFHDIPAADQYLFSSDKVWGVPPFQASASYDHTIPLGGDTLVILTGDVRYTGHYAGSRLTDLTASQGGYPWVRSGGEATANLSATLMLDDGRLSLTGYVRNLFDARFKSGGTGFASTEVFSLVPFVNSVASLADPRTFGVVFSARF